MKKKSQEKNERQKTNDSLINERIRTDEVFENQSISAENKTDNELYHLLKQVREKTDKDLLNERVQTDFDVQESTSLLTAEQMAHTSTRAELTTREEFLAIVSHDLRNPIGSISSCTEMLLTDPDYANMSGELKYWIEFVKRNADTSLRLISDILDMERIAEGKLNLQVAMNNLSDLINEVLENHMQMAASKSILLQASATMSSDTWIIFDRDRIAQVLSNLMSNAIKFTPEGGSITVDLRSLEHHVQVSVKDTGPGIADDQKNRIFKRYAQIENKDRRGLGLGLYISMMFVELHGGKIWVSSSLGQGSTFYFTLAK